MVSSSQAEYLIIAAVFPQGNTVPGPVTRASINARATQSQLNRSAHKPLSMPKFRQRKAAPKPHSREPQAVPEVSLEKSALPQTAPNTARKKTGTSWSKLRWPVCGLIALAFCGGLKVAADISHERAEKERAIERAKPKPPAPPLCTQVTITELKNPDGSVKGTERAERQVRCERQTIQVYTPYEFPLWLKIVGWTLVVLYVLMCIWTRSPIVPIL
jgi:hypothetical protein